MGASVVRSVVANPASSNEATDASDDGDDGWTYNETNHHEQISDKKVCGSGILFCQQPEGDPILWPGQNCRVTANRTSSSCFQSRTCLPRQQQRRAGMRLVGLLAALAAAVHGAVVPLYRVFELSIPNSNTTAANRFSGVWLNATFHPPDPSAPPRAFWGFYDGEVDRVATWKLRWMPNATGSWRYNYSFSDGSMAGAGSFECVSAGSSPGVIQVYEKNPHWFAYNGDRPVFLKSYYVKAGGLTRQPIEWAGPNLYQKMVDRGYNHHMSSGFLPVLPLTAEWDGQPLLDGPAAINATIYTDPRSPSSSMQLDVWQSLEAHLAFLNRHDIAVDFFQGFNAAGPDSGRLQFGALPELEKRWWVSYVVARLAPYANVMGWVYSWETGGTGDDLHLARLLHQMDPFRHMCTYEDANAIASNWYNLSEWDFASVETYGGVASHHNMSLQAYRGKPVYMTEGHMLWRSFWYAAEPVVVSAAWAVTTAAASFSWNDMGVHRITGPYNASQAFATYPSAVESIDILADVMANKTGGFHLLTPADQLLREPPPLTFCLAQPGKQYLVYSDSGESFVLDAGPGSFGVTWFDAVDAANVVRPEGTVSGIVKLTPPSTKTHWVAVLLNT